MGDQVLQHFQHETARLQQQNDEFQRELQKMREERDRHVALAIPPSWVPKSPPRMTPSMESHGAWVSPESFHCTPNGTRVPPGPPPPDPPALPVWPPEISSVEPSVEPPTKIRGVMGGNGNRSSDVCSPRAARNLWFEREVAALQEKLDQEALKNKQLSGYWSIPFLTESAREKELAESVACMKRQAGMTDRGMSSEAAGHHGIFHGDRAFTEHALGDICHPDRASLQHVHGDVFHGDRACMQHVHGGVFHGDRASLQHVHGSVSHGDRASMQHVHGSVSHGDRANMQHVHGRVFHGDRASMQHDHGLVGSQRQVGAEHEHGDVYARGRASTEHEHGDVYARGRASTEHGHGDVYARGRASTAHELGDVYGPVRARKEQLLEGVCTQDRAGRQRSMSRGDRDVVEDGDLKAIPITLPLLPSPEGRDSSLEAGDWLIQLAPLVGDLSKNAASWWRRVMQATTDKYSEWLYADPLARLKNYRPRKLQDLCGL